MTTAGLNAKATKIGSKKHDTASFITTQEFNRLTKISFDAKMKEAAKILASKSKVDHALDKKIKIERKKNCRRLIWVNLLVDFFIYFTTPTGSDRTLG